MALQQAGHADECDNPWGSSLIPCRPVVLERSKNAYDSTLRSFDNEWRQEETSDDGFACLVREHLQAQEDATAASAEISRLTVLQKHRTFTGTCHTGAALHD